ncbi:MAG: DUF883 C-terminal domain-containing protein [Verrucomicrobiota bacterium]
MKTATAHRETITDSLNSVADGVKDLVQENVENGVSQIKKASTGISKKVKENPLASLAIAAGVGLVVGRILKK